MIGIFYLTPDPSPARTIVNERNALLAGEGRKRERGLRPLSINSPPLERANNCIFRVANDFRDGLSPAHRTIFGQVGGDV